MYYRLGEAVDLVYTLINHAYTVFSKRTGTEGPFLLKAAKPSKPYISLEGISFICVMLSRILDPNFQRLIRGYTGRLCHGT